MSKLKVNQIEANSGANIFVTGSLTVSETIIAREVRTSITSSQILVSGSTKFGDTVDDNHEFTGSVLLANDATITGTLTLGNYSDISASLDTAEDNITANSASAATALTSLSSSVDTHLDANILALSSSTDSHLDSEIALLSASTDSHLDSEITLISSSCHSQRISEDSVLSGSAHTVRIAFSSSAATALTGLSSSAEVSRATLDTAQTAALNSYTASNNTRLDGIEAVTSSYALSATSATTGSNTFTGDQIVSSSVLLTIQPIETAPVSASTGSLIVSGSPAQLYIFNGSGSGWNRV